MRSLRTDLGVSIAASLAVFAFAVVGGQMLVAATTPATTAAASTTMTSCLERPLTPIGTPGVLGVANLCLTVDDVEVAVKLTSAASRDLYTAWLAFHDRPGAGAAGACPVAEGAADARRATPGRVDAVVAPQDGDVQLSRLLPGLRPAGNTQLEILVVDHGPSSPAGSPDRTRHLLSWDGIWSAPARSTTVRPDGTPHLFGCAAFWLRGGAELTEH